MSSVETGKLSTYEETLGAVCSKLVVGSAPCAVRGGERTEDLEYEVLVFFLL